MNSKFNKALGLINTLSLEEQEQLIETEKKKIIEKKRKILSKHIKEAQSDIENGDCITGDYKEVMKAIDDEVKSNKKI